MIEGFEDFIKKIHQLRQNVIDCSKLLERERKSHQENLKQSIERKERKLKADIQV
jgi:hypothetical protein